jgi:hypothetical protein
MFLIRPYVCVCKPTMRRFPSLARPYLLYCGFFEGRIGGPTEYQKFRESTNVGLGGKVYSNP